MTKSRKRLVIINAIVEKGKCNTYDLHKVVKIIKSACGKRTTFEVYVLFSEISQSVLATPIWMGGITQKIEVGGAVIIAVDACYYEKT